MLLAALGCRLHRDPKTDPRIDFYYAVSTAPPEKTQQVERLPMVELAATDAELGAVVRELAKQAGITVVYPQQWQDMKWTGEIKGACDVVLDALARSYALRFTWSSGIGFIGTPIAEDRTIGVVQSSLTDPERVLQPLLSETGKVTSGLGWIFLADRNENVLRVITALKQMKQKFYVVQLLETLVDDNQSASLSVQQSNTLEKYLNTNLYDRQIEASLTDSGAFLGRTWLTVIGEGREFSNFLGQTELREKVIITADNQIIRENVYVQTGLKITYKIQGGSCQFTLMQDSTDNSQYSTQGELPQPGLFLVHTSAIKSEYRQAGWPQSSYRHRNAMRYVWIRYNILGQMDPLAHPIVQNYDPVSAEPERAERRRVGTDQE